MVFNSYTFFAFFISFFFLYWFGFKNLKMQNLLLLAGSYFFYAWADWRFLLFLVGVSALNFFLGIYIEKSPSEKNKKWLLYIGLLQGIGGLAFFKYYNFFVVSIKEALSTVNITAGLQTLDIIIPLGISFFTFRTISYLLDIEKGKLEATKDWVVFFNYVAFFPTILSGPIDKAKMFIPQLEKERTFDYDLAVNGMQQILWGFFKKIAIANSCAVITDEIFKNYQNLPASTLLIGAFFYTIQIYADFSGYSDMAIGFSKLLGFRITKNFEYPFFAQNIADFWRRWHISLTAWLTEYVFTPLSIAFRDYGNLGLVLAIVINFTIIGIWHGANWTYVLFGFLHGCYYIPLILNGTMNKKKKLSKDKNLPSLSEAINMVLTFILVMFTFVLFRAETIAQAFDYYRRLVSKSLLALPVIDMQAAILTLFLTIIMLVTEWINRNEEHGLVIQSPNAYKRWGVYTMLLLALFFFGVYGENQFIYFQF
jgi:alginate O-acetyltransferase complex protein AlgI